MAKAELVFANALDLRHWQAEGETGQPNVYVQTLGGRALPFGVIRHWKAPQGYAIEHFQLIAPSGSVAYASTPVTRRFPGQMDLFRVSDVVEDAVFHELGIYAISLLIEGELQAQADFQVLLSAAPSSLPKAVEDGLKKSDVIWVGDGTNGKTGPVPAWFVYRQGRIYVLHGGEKSGEQLIPGLPEARELTVVTRRKGRDTSSDRFPASVRLIPPESPEYDGLASVLADRRRDRHIAPAQTVANWRASYCLVAELTPTIS
jgi:hypothetical protein